MQTQTTIVKWGNSQAVRMPKAILDSVLFKVNDTVEVTAENGQIVIKKVSPEPTHKMLRQRVEEFYGKDFDTVIDEDRYDFEEIGWGAPMGDEVW